MEKTCYCGHFQYFLHLPLLRNVLTLVADTLQHTGTEVIQHFHIMQIRMWCRVMRVSGLFIFKGVNWEIELCPLSHLSTGQIVLDLAPLQFFFFRCFYTNGLGRKSKFWVWQGSEQQWEGDRCGLLLSEGQHSWQVSSQCCSAKRNNRTLKIAQY